MLKKCSAIFFIAKMLHLCPQSWMIWFLFFRLLMWFWHWTRLFLLLSKTFFGWIGVLLALVFSVYIDRYIITATTKKSQYFIFNLITLLLIYQNLSYEDFFKVMMLICYTTLEPPWPQFRPSWLSSGGIRFSINYLVLKGTKRYNYWPNT